MSANLYARVSPHFSAEAMDGVLIAGYGLNDTYGFTELGYDQVDYTVAPIVIEIVARAGRYASREDVYAAARRKGVAEETLQEDEPNLFLFDADIVSDLRSQGFVGFRDFITVSNTAPDIHAFWDAAGFDLVGFVEVVAEDPAEPYDVRLPTPAPGL